MEEGEKERVTERIKEGEEQNLGGFQSQNPEGQKQFKETWDNRHANEETHTHKHTHRFIDIFQWVINKCDFKLNIM